MATTLSCRQLSTTVVKLSRTTESCILLDIVEVLPLSGGAASGFVVKAQFSNPNLSMKAALLDWVCWLPVSSDGCFGDSVPGKWLRQGHI